MKRWAVPILAAVIAAAAVSGWWTARRAASEMAVRVAKAESEAAEWRKKADEADKAREAAQAAQTEGVVGEAPQPGKGTGVVEDVVTRRELVKLLGEKDEKITGLTAANEQLRAQLEQFDEKVAGLTKETQRLTASEKDLQDKLDTARRLAEALRTESAGAASRTQQLEGLTQQLRQREEENRQKSARLLKVADATEELARRREMFLSNILRRYREVTEMYRGLALQTSAQRDGAPAAVAGNDLSRIQTAVYQAEDDMRQLQALNAQASRLQKELAAARK